MAHLALLYESFQELKPILENRFPTYFAPFSLSRAKVSWVEEQCHVEMARASKVPYAYKSVDTRILAIGTGIIGIPTGLFRATFSFDFKIHPEERLVENRMGDLFWYGQGFEHAEGWGTVSYPLMRAFLSAADNHVYLRFDGYYQATWGAGGLVNTYPFIVWQVDLGEASRFEEYVNFSVWLNFETRSFNKVFVGGKAIPFPEGYAEITPTQYKTALWNGVLIGDLFQGDTTNFKMMVDDVMVYADYFIPAPPAGLCAWQKATVVSGFAAAVLFPIGYGVVQSEKKR